MASDVTEPTSDDGDVGEEPGEDAATPPPVTEGGSGTPSTEPPVSDGATGTCTVSASGAREESWTFPQDVTSFSSDYWTSEDDLRQTVELLGEDIAGGTYDEIVARGEPIITFLSLSCSDPDELIRGALVLPTNATRASDLPMGPGSYPISGGLFDAEGPAGTVIADFSVAEEDELYGTIADSGTLEITAWDRSRIEGSFSFRAREAFTDSPKEVQVVVTFSFVCEDALAGC